MDKTSYAPHAAGETSAERMALRMQMERFAQALREIGDTTREVSRKLGSMHLCSVEDVWQQTMILSAGNVPGGTGAGRVNSTRPWTL